MATELRFGEVLDYIANRESPSFWKYECKIITPSRTMRVIDVISIDTICDFVNNFADEKVIKVSMTQGDYDRYVYPHRENIQIVLEKVFTTKSGLPLQITPFKLQYYAIAQEAKDNDLQDKPMVDKDQQLKVVSFDLHDLVSFNMRFMSYNVPSFDVSCGDYVKFAYHTKMESLSLSEDMKPKGITCEKFGVEKARKQIVPPHGLKLMDLPFHLQKEEGGIYNHGLGMYYHVYYRNWFLYSLYNSKKYKDSKYNMDIYLARSNKSLGLDNTWRIKREGKTTLSVLSTAGYNQIDTSDIDFLTEGNGIKFSIANKIWDGFMSGEGNVGNIDGSHRAEFVLKNRNSKFQVSKTLNSRVTNNVARERSKLSARAGKFLMVSWEYCEIDHIIPSMPVRIFFDTESEEKYLDGTVLKILANERPTSNDITPGKVMTGSSRLLLFVEDPDLEFKM